MKTEISLYYSYWGEGIDATKYYLANRVSSSDKLFSKRVKKNNSMSMPRAVNAPKFRISNTHTFRAC